ncbi:DUF4180 domain-containing protein [Sphingobacterium paludis]|uniref:Uncharacterized protein DUF4180 n=1 Tax=Sphingobacterium paludis TaxID=1476465 RepID=A0A4R7DAX2_9SPHI|nr:DUF4180 domain-containing protein [Sphingobacterium paludis]TDS16236.1 uncharacterized protein DUF4180 [Sphingobacterium paludis]
MHIIEHIVNQKLIASIASDIPVIRDVESGTDFVGEIYYLGYDAVILDKTHLVADFFDLKTKLAGEILQKFSNYRLRLALVGNWEQETSSSLQDFIRESNAGRLIYFASSTEDALKKFCS